ncbi:MAG: hypothetical protein AAF988_06145 [Pseudomonadota bacterium]
MTLDIDIAKVTQDDGFIYAYGDGAYSDKTKQIASAAIIATKDPTKPEEIVTSIHRDDADPRKDETLSKIYNSGNFQRASRAYYAEYVAFINALEAIPKGSHVIYHTDEHAVFNAIVNMTGSDQRLLPITRGNPQKVERILKDRLQNAIDKHASVSAVLATDKAEKAIRLEQDELITYFMTRANNKASEAAGSPNIKPLPKLSSGQSEPGSP